MRDEQAKVGGGVATGGTVKVEERSTLVVQHHLIGINEYTT